MKGEQGTLNNRKEKKYEKELEDGMREVDVEMMSKWKKKTDKGIG